MFVIKEAPTKRQKGERNKRMKVRIACERKHRQRGKNWSGTRIRKVDKPRILPVKGEVRIAYERKNRRRGKGKSETKGGEC